MKDGLQDGTNKDNSVIHDKIRQASVKPPSANLKIEIATVPVITGNK